MSRHELWLHPDGRHEWISIEHRQWQPRLRKPWWKQGAYTLGPGNTIQPARRLPDGAIIADLRRQNRGMGPPLRLYLDLQRTCEGCQSRFVFTAAEQQRWYEELEIWGEVIPRFCLRCRRARRQDSASHRQLAEAIDRIKADPKDTDAHLLAAQATASLASRIGTEALRRGLGHARKAAARADLEAEARQAEAAIRSEIAIRSSQSRSR